MLRIGLAGEECWVGSKSLSSAPRAVSLPPGPRAQDAPAGCWGLLRSGVTRVLSEPSPGVARACLEPHPGTGCLRRCCLAPQGDPASHTGTHLSAHLPTHQTFTKGLVPARHHRLCTHTLSPRAEYSSNTPAVQGLSLPCCPSTPSLCADAPAVPGPLHWQLPVPPCV